MLNACNGNILRRTVWITKVPCGAISVEAVRSTRPVLPMSIDVYRLATWTRDVLRISPVPFLRTWIRFWRSRHVASSAAHRMARLNLSIPKGLNSVQQRSFDRRLMKPTARTECHSHCMVGCNPTFIMFSSRIPFKSLGRTARRTAGRN